MNRSALTIVAVAMGTMVLAAGFGERFIDGIIQHLEYHMVQA